MHYCRLPSHETLRQSTVMMDSLHIKIASCIPPPPQQRLRLSLPVRAGRAGRSTLLDEMTSCPPHSHLQLIGTAFTYHDLIHRTHPSQQLVLQSYVSVENNSQQLRAMPRKNRGAAVPTAGSAREVDIYCQGGEHPFPLDDVAGEPWHGIRYTYRQGGVG